MSEQTNRLFVPGAIFLGFFLVAGALFWGLRTYGYRTAHVDMTRVYSQESKVYQEIYADLQQKSAEAQQKLTTAKTEAEKGQIRQEFEQYQTKKQEEYAVIVKKALATVAQKRNIDTIANTQTFIYSKIDLTEEVLEVIDAK